MTERQTGEKYYSLLRDTILDYKWQFLHFCSSPVSAIICVLESFINLVYKLTHVNVFIYFIIIILLVITKPDNFPYSIITTEVLMNFLSFSQIKLNVSNINMEISFNHLFLSLSALMHLL